MKETIAQQHGLQQIKSSIDWKKTFQQSTPETCLQNLSITGQKDQAKQLSVKVGTQPLENTQKQNRFGQLQDFRPKSKSLVPPFSLTEKNSLTDYLSQTDTVTKFRELNENEFYKVKEKCTLMLNRIYKHQQDLIPYHDLASQEKYRKTIAIYFDNFRATMMIKEMPEPIGMTAYYDALQHYPDTMVKQTFIQFEQTHIYSSLPKLAEFLIVLKNMENETWGKDERLLRRSLNLLNVIENGKITDERHRR